MHDSSQAMGLCAVPDGRCALSPSTPRPSPPPAPRPLLPAQEVLTVGVGSHGDAMKLRRDHGLELGGVVCLSDLANQRRLPADPHAVRGAPGDAVNPAIAAICRRSLQLSLGEEHMSPHPRVVPVRCREGQDRSKSVVHAIRRCNHRGVSLHRPLAARQAAGAGSQAAATAAAVATPRHPRALTPCLLDEL